MALVDPRPLADLADLLPVRSTRWKPFRIDQLEIFGSSKTLALGLADPLWSAELEVDWSLWDDARDLQAAINSLQGAEQTFLFCNPMARFPRLDPTGAGLTGYSPKLSAIDSDNKRVKFNGLPAGYHLSRGDFWHIDFSSAPTRRGLFELSEAGVADGTGLTGWITTFPHVWPGIVTGADVALVNPAAKVFITPGSYDAGGTLHARVEGMRFTVLQKL